jgi:NAD(P)-dependent dehydrogenase (short-subunit alcohol dehydrogenase family)
MKDLSGKVAMITGASGNLGSATTRKFLDHGGKLALVDHAAERLLQEYGDNVPSPDLYLSPSVDLTDSSQLKPVVDEILAKYGHVDVLVNITGGFHGGTPVHETSVDELKGMFELNVTTMFNSSHAVVPLMLERGAGSIINIGARSGLKGTSKQGAYAAAKSAVIRLTESMSAELKHNGIRVNCVLPGTIDTLSNREDMPQADFSRWVAAEAIADLILFLASEKSIAITGAAIPAYGTG